MKRLFLSLIALAMMCGLAVSANAQLVDNGDGTVTDSKTGLMWLKNANQAGPAMTWAEANSWANNLVFAGHSDWRLPSGANPDGSVCNSRPTGANCTQTEFWSLYQGALGVTFVNPGPFENVNLYYWTSTEWTGDPANGMSQDMWDGGQNDFPKDSNFLAWAVRDVPGGPSPVPIDVWIKDCAADVGSVPTSPNPCPQWWTSPDIWIDNDDNFVIDAPVYGADNTLKALVRNNSSAWAMIVTVNFYYRDASTGLIFPDGASLIGTDRVHVPANGYAIASTLWRNLPANPSGGHWCIGVVLTHDDDPAITPAVQPYQDNNVGVANIWFLAQRAGEQVTLPFNVGTGGSGGFGLGGWPRDFVLKVVDRLPPGWSWTLEGIGADQPFTLKLDEERTVQLNIQVAEEAAPHTGGAVEVRQVDVATERVVGGVQFNLYEDHRPPERVRSLTASLGTGRPVLTWDRVFVEAETGLTERVAYYEIFRNGKAVAKVMRDEEPTQPGMQWTDPDLVTGRLTYAVRVVDEGGNISVVSAKATVTMPGRLFNWLTWLLVILILILVILLLKRRSATQP